MTEHKIVDHAERKHALLSASGASRWLNCTPSPRLEEPFPSSTSFYADEGTLAHEFAEINLKAQLDLMPEDEYSIQYKELTENVLYSVVMEDEVQKHIDYVIQQFREAQRITPDAVLLIENKIDLTYYIEDGFGTNDDVIIADGVLEVIDLKYGKGVRVKAEENSQLKLYGLGALRAYELMYDIHTIRLTVTQPRLDSISSWEVSVEDLKKWGEEIVKPKAIEAFAGDGELAPGEWCRFCKVKAKCRALKERNMEVIREDFKDVKLLDDPEILKVYKMHDEIVNWLNSVSDFVAVQALAGKKWEGLKLVAGRSNRAFTDTEKIEDVLLTEGYTKDQFLTNPQPKLLGIGAIEKLVGKNNIDVILGDYIHKPEGKPTLVDESDKRPEYFVATAADDFGSEDDDNLLEG